MICTACGIGRLRTSRMRLSDFPYLLLLKLPTRCDLCATRLCPSKLVIDDFFPLCLLLQLAPPIKLRDRAEMCWEFQVAEKPAVRTSDCSRFTQPATTSIDLPSCGKTEASTVIRLEPSRAGFWRSPCPRGKDIQLIARTP